MRRGNERKRGKRDRVTTREITEGRKQGNNVTENKK
jgi:hypothetical protein